MTRRRRFSAQFKARDALKEQKTIAEQAVEFEVHPNQISQWKRRRRAWRAYRASCPVVQNSARPVHGVP